MAQGSDVPVAAPKLHGTFTMTRLSGAGVVLTRRPTESDPDRVVLAIGDSATNLVLDGTLDEIRSLVAAASAQLSRLHRPDGRPAPNGDQRSGGDGGVGAPAGPTTGQ